MDNKFVFIIPSFNNKDWYYANIYSLINQNYPHWRAIYINDCSTDGTPELVKELVSKEKLTHKFTFIDNSSNFGPAASRYFGYQNTLDDEVCCMLDGDDSLYGNNVLSILNNAYNAGYNSTYGCYYSLINGSTDYFMSPKRYVIPNFLITDEPYRKKYDWFCMHLRTMRAYLIKNIPEHHLKINNEWIKCCSDMAEGYYVLENLHTKIIKIEQPIYIYNRDNSIRYPLSYYRSDESHFEYKNMVYNYIKNL